MRKRGSARWKSRTEVASRGALQALADGAGGSKMEDAMWEDASDDERASRERATDERATDAAARGAGRLCAYKTAKGPGDRLTIAGFGLRRGPAGLQVLRRRGPGA